MAPRKARSPEANQFDNYIAALIEKRRKKLGISQADFARDLGIDASTLNYYESGRSRVPSYLLLKIAPRLKISLDSMARRLSVCQLLENRRAHTRD